MDDSLHDALSNAANAKAFIDLLGEAGKDGAVVAKISYGGRRFSSKDHTSDVSLSQIIKCAEEVLKKDPTATGAQKLEIASRIKKLDKEGNDALTKEGLGSEFLHWFKSKSASSNERLDKLNKMGDYEQDLINGYVAKKLEEFNKLPDVQHIQSVRERTRRFNGKGYGAQVVHFRNAVNDVYGFIKDQGGLLEVAKKQEQMDNKVRELVNGGKIAEALEEQFNHIFDARLNGLSNKDKEKYKNAFKEVLKELSPITKEKISSMANNEIALKLSEKVHKEFSNTYTSNNVSSCLTVALSFVESAIAKQAKVGG